LEVAALLTTRKRPQDCPQESARWALLVVAEALTELVVIAAGVVT
jgi:hypothetical protein